MGSLQLSHPKVSLTAFTNCNSPPISQDSGLKTYFLFPSKNTLGGCIHKQVPITQNFPVLSSQDHVLRRTKDHVVLLTVKNTFRQAPDILKDCHLKQGSWKRRRGSYSTAVGKQSLPGAGMDRQGKCTTANTHTLSFHKELGSIGLEMERAAVHLRWTTTVREERCSSLDMLLWKKNIKPIKMTNIASIFPSPSAERPVITHLWVSTLLALCNYPWLPVGKRDIFFISDSYYIL